MIDVENVNRSFPHYPRTVEDKGWVYGVWFCGTAWTKVTLHGQYPPTFMKRALALFPLVEAYAILHCPSGAVSGPGITVDVHQDAVRKPQVVADAAHLPFNGGCFSVVLSDPPYTKADASIYGCRPFPMKQFMSEAHRTLKPNGYLGILHLSYPSYSRKQWKLRGLIAVVTGFLRATRMFSIFERLE